jgi:hypothetical protein
MFEYLFLDGLKLERTKAVDFVNDAKRLLFLHINILLHAQFSGKPSRYFPTAHTISRLRIRL